MARIARLLRRVANRLDPVPAPRIDCRVSTPADVGRQVVHALREYERRHGMGR